MLYAIALPMLGGFVLFLSGMRTMESALQRSVGRRLHRILARFTSTPLHGLAVGTAATAVLQSSTAVTVMSIGMVNAGLLTFPRTLGIVLGTNIGTCLTTELIGLNLGKHGLPLLAFSIGLWLLTAVFGEMGFAGSRTDGTGMARMLAPLRTWAVVTGGFALLLIGIRMMQSIAPAVRSTAFFDAFLSRADASVFWGLAAGIMLTAAIHSSAAVIGIVMGLAETGAMPVEVGVAIVLGANVGTCVTAVIAALGGTRSGRFVAWSHVLLNLGGAALFAPFAPQLGAAAAWLSSSPASQIAHAQTLFNVACSLLALPLCYHPRIRRLNAA
ncbi:Na/Pi cotransporter family protein [Paenibacillus sacheonensis]|uniref:Na/Pi cotransporter family protein n=1 Tax=Paenibacillus sacheonensis TaxID=742054 RepID=A0A7X5C0N5_9BACL|nr:Na/Pi symporter [Paenibacillus sacheonensis]MBM7565632.1 phosphate:Na+ symporter [Paenibacillus sacheonensis]NBC69450.1 Na/Pi cotransporter family protein [Paenibacillus sacheonensis]